MKATTMTYRSLNLYGEKIGIKDNKELWALKHRLFIVDGLGIVREVPPNKRPVARASFTKI